MNLWVSLLSFDSVLGWDVNNIKIKNSGFDPLTFIQAKKFMDAALSLEEEHRDDPYYVLLAFAIELFLKCLQVTHSYEFESDPLFKVTAFTRKGVKGHNLSDIFQSLPKDTRDQLSGDYQRRHYDNLEADLKLIGDAFVDHRYIHEKRSHVSPVGLLCKISDSLHRSIKESRDLRTTRESLNNSLF